MTTLMPLIKKELRAYLNSAIAYVVLVFFLIISSIFLFEINSFFAANVATLRPYFDVFPFLFIILIPALTMRLWAEERRQGTWEILATLPYSETQLVLGKFLSTFILFLGMMVMTVPVVIIVSAFGSFDGGAIFSNYLGLVFLGAAEIALGQFISSMTKNQIVAFLLTAALLLILTLMSLIANLPGMSIALASVFNYLSVTYHFDSFIKGILDSRDLLYFVILTVIFLYSNSKVLVYRKWS